MEKPTQKDVQRLFDYNPETGILTRKVSIGKAKKDTVAGNKHIDGYLQVGVMGRCYGVHIIAWLHYYGNFPKRFLDHINRNRYDNRIKNLRESSDAQNQRNRKVSNRNKVGITGIRFVGSSWTVYIGKENKNYHLGSFKDFTEAVCTRLAAEQCIDWNSYRYNSPAHKYVQKYVQKKNLI